MSTSPTPTAPAGSQQRPHDPATRHPHHPWRRRPQPRTQLLRRPWLDPGRIAGQGRLLPDEWAGSGAVRSIRPRHRSGRPDAALGTGAMTLAQNFMTEAEVDGAYANALAAGATPLKPPEKVVWGGYSGYFADPDGHVWELAMNPFWPLSPDGSLTLPEAP